MNFQEHKKMLLIPYITSPVTLFTSAISFTARCISTVGHDFLLLVRNPCIIIQHSRVHNGLCINFAHGALPVTLI